MSSRVYVVVSEDYYGGDYLRVFNTADAKADAESYVKECVEKTQGKYEFIVKEVDMVEM